MDSQSQPVIKETPAPRPIASDFDVLARLGAHLAARLCLHAALGCVAASRWFAVHGKVPRWQRSHLN